MCDYPEGIDGGRLFEYIESIGDASVMFGGREYAVRKPAIDEMVDDMVVAGLLRPAITRGPFPHRIFEVCR
jgi:hypothetical protein